MRCRQRWTVSEDGASLAFWDEGEGPVVVMTNGYANSTLYWEHLRQRLRQNYRVIRWDLRGHGRSGAARDPETMTVEGCADDLRRILDAAEVDNAVLAGFSFGCQIVLESWRHFPERIEGLIPVLGPCESPFNTLIDPRIGPLIYRFYQGTGPSVWSPLLKLGSRVSRLEMIHGLVQKIGFVGSNVTLKEMEPFYLHLAEIHAPSWYALGLGAQRHSARDILSSIDVPTLVVAGGGDRFSPGELGREIAEAITDAQLTWIEDATHTGLFDAPEIIGEAVEEFLPRVFSENRPITVSTTTGVS